MSAVFDQLKTCYEVNNMSIEEISIELSLELPVVKAGLMHCSPKYRRDVGAEDTSANGLDFSEDDLRQVNRAIFELAMDPDVDPSVRTKNLHYIRDDKKGRKEIQKHLQGNTFNILQFNEQIAKTRELTSNIKARFIEAKVV